MRKPSGSERARFLEEGSELRTKLVFLAGENQRADALACLIAHAPQMDREVHSLLEDFLFGNPDFTIIIRLIM